MVKELSSDKRQRCVDGAFSLAHMDLEGCTISLASKILPLLLTRSSVLARYLSFTYPRESLTYVIAIEVMKK